MTDAIDLAMSKAAGVPAKRIPFAIQAKDGTTKPVEVVLPNSLTWEELVAVSQAVLTFGSQMIDAREAVGLTLVKGSLPNA